MFDIFYHHMIYLQFLMRLHNVSIQLSVGYYTPDSFGVMRTDKFLGLMSILCIDEPDLHSGICGFAVMGKVI